MAKMILSIWPVKPGLSRLLAIILTLTAIAIPFFVTFFLITFYLEKQLLNFVPISSDEIYFWHQVSTFQSTGFSGGYYSGNEKSAAAPFVHFGAHGPFYPIILGTISLLTGWEMYSPLFFNIAFLTLAIILFIAVTKPDNLQLALLCLVILTCWPIQLYIPSGMRLVLFESLAIIFSALFYKTLIKPGASFFLLILFFGTILVMTFLKITNALLFITFVLLIYERIGLSALQGVVAAIILIVLCFFVNSQLVAPYPYGFEKRLFASPLDEWPGLLTQQGASNIRKFFDLNQNNLWLILRAQLLLAIAFSFFLLWRKGKDRKSRQECIFILVYSGLTVIATIFLYDVFSWRDYRVFAPIVLTNTLLFIARRRVILVVLMIAGNLVVLPDFFNAYDKFVTGSFPGTGNTMVIESFKEKIAPIIKYERNENSWNNTLLVSLKNSINIRMLGVPAGIGLSYFTSPDKLSEIKSRYLLLDKGTYKALKGCSMLEYMLKTDIGDLYINRGMKCEN